MKASDEDLAWLRPDISLMTAATELLGGATRVVLVTTGGTATTIVTPAGAVTVPVDAVAVVDTIGAGDAFTAGFASWWVLGGRGRDDLVDVDALTAAVAAAHTVAAVVVSRRGADPPTRAELPADWS